MQHQRVKSLFADALELDQATRSAFLDAQCDGDDALRTKVMELLRVHDSASGFMDSPTISKPTLDEMAGFSHEAQHEGPGATIEKYRLESLIGEGGFGSVFRAQQTHPIRRPVALKIIKQGMDTRRVMQRFEAERQALARLEHPGIAMVLDAGTTPSGRPFFVMELVDGEPITRACDRLGLDIAARLRLFVQVCRAVQHAHVRGIIHRDLKPANILVAESTQFGSDPACKIIDFGIAKVTAGDEGFAAQSGVTVDTAFVGTPEYASPEQLRAREVDTRSDVYSLGVLLVELLVGTTPRAGLSRTSQLLSAARNEAWDTPALPPSVLLQQLAKHDDASAALQAQSRGCDGSASLLAKVRGELDWICLCCLETDPARRYQSSLDLGLDIERYLQNDAIVAAPPSRWYSARKFVSRNKAAVVAGTVVAMGVLAGGIGVSYGLVKTRQSEARTREQLARADTVSRVLIEGLRSAGPSVARGRDTTMMREVLERAEQTLATDPTAQSPKGQIEVRNAIADVYVELAEFEKALEIARVSYDLATKSLPDDDPLWRGTPLLSLLHLLGQVDKFLDDFCRLNGPALVLLDGSFEHVLERASLDHVLLGSQLDLVVQQFLEQFKGKIPLRQTSDLRQELIAENADVRSLQPGSGEDVNDALACDGLRDDLPHCGVEFLGGLL